MVFSLLSSRSELSQIWDKEDGWCWFMTPGRACIRIVVWIKSCCLRFHVSEQDMVRFPRVCICVVT
jgi:hypothetical protein